MSDLSLFSKNIYFFSFQKKSKQQKRQKRLKAYDLSSLTEFLPDPELKAPQKPGPEDDIKVNCKSRQKLLWVLLFIIQYYIASFTFDICNIVFVTLCPCWSDWRKHNIFLRSLTILSSNQIPCLPFINTYRTHYRL